MNKQNLPIVLNREHLNMEVSVLSPKEVEKADQIVAERVMELFQLIQSAIEQQATQTDSEPNQLLLQSMQMIQMGLMMIETGKLRKWLNSLNEILLAVGKWDLPPDSYQKQIEPLILPFLEAL